MGKTERERGTYFGEVVVLYLRNAPVTVSLEILKIVRALPRLFAE